jgi:DNA repair protein RadC
MQQQNNWNDGTWHRALLENQQPAFDTIATKLQFDDHWQCASFLAGCGYLIPYSLYAARGWNNWSGQQNSAVSFNSWWRQLAEVSPARNAVFKLDRRLDCLFNPDFSILEKPLCLESAVCCTCPLSGSCRFLATTINPDRTRDFVNQARTGDLKNLSTEDLVLLLAGETWNGTEFQKSLIASFPNIAPSLSAEAQSPAEESMLVKLLGVKEIAARIKDEPSAFTGKSFICASDIFEHYKHKLGNETQESFYTVILDNKHRIISTRLISLGTLNQSLVHPREVFAPAIQLRAAAIILVHNHPSGDPTPSNQDIAITQRLKDVGEIVGIKVLDHVIVGSQRFFSFVDENLLKS